MAKILKMFWNAIRALWILGVLKERDVLGTEVTKIILEGMHLFGYQTIFHFCLILR